MLYITFPFLTQFLFFLDFIFSFFSLFIMHLSLLSPPQTLYQRANLLLMPLDLTSVLSVLLPVISLPCALSSRSPSGLLRSCGPGLPFTVILATCFASLSLQPEAPFPECHVSLTLRLRPFGRGHLLPSIPESRYVAGKLLRPWTFETS